MKVSTTAKRRWIELSGAKLPSKPTAAIRALLTGLGNMRQHAANPDVVVAPRLVEGKLCKKRAEIAGWYSKTLAAGEACIGADAVKAILDEAAKKMCCDTLQCPKECPCEYIPQKKLAIYRCGNGVEEGYLMQRESVWNCVCGIVI